MDTTTAAVSAKSNLQAIIKYFTESRPFRELVGRLADKSAARLAVSGLAGSSPAILLASLAHNGNRPIIAIASNPDESDDLYDDLKFLLGEGEVEQFPTLGIPPFEFRSPSAEVIGRRLSAISSIRQGSAKIIVTSVNSLVEPTITKEDFETGSLHLKVGEVMDLEELAEKLVGLGFQRVPLVEEIGDFALRGGLIDFFSPGFNSPVRVEFFGDEIETIRQFDVATQRTTDRLNEVRLLPRREVTITPATIEKYLEKIPEDDADLIRSRYLNDPELPGLEWLALSFGHKRGSFLDFVPESALYFTSSAGIFNGFTDNLIEDAKRRRERLLNRLTILPKSEEYYRNSEKAIPPDNTSSIDHILFKGGREDVIDFGCKEHPAFGSRLDLLATTVSSFRNQGFNFFIAADNPGQASRLSELLSEKMERTAVAPVEVALLKGGFVCKQHRFAILTDHQIFGRYFRRTRRKKFKEGVAIQNYTSLSNGDYVVHTDFGIARYCGLQTITVQSRERDCLLLKYANDDKLYVPIEEFNRVSKYSGKDGAPKLTSLGGPSWEKIKTRTKKAIADMAEELIKLYAERKTKPGYTFGPDTTWLKQLEASFIYEETPDQLKAIDAIKEDMQKGTPMDRLVCGDVGYGKTEVAVRAAFKAVEAGKQVAVLVPTTILAQQHLSTFSQRLADFPVRIEMLSRFKTKMEQKVTVTDLSEGKVDIVIGTHRLLSKDVVIPNLGLLVVDEEQRFGVKHKETLRKLKTQVDTIAMTATPIPRTLQMSLMGVRDMSLINTSPKDRLPIITQISEFSAEVIGEAIMKEVDRGGQIYFVHNRVQTIESIHHYLKKLLPQVEIAVAHGQMHERSLEGIMLAFLARKFQLLLCTSIIESGLDIPSVNTIIINRADRFGLAQLYQLRGRVGRSSVRAHAYLLTPPYRLLTEDARKRLRAIEAHAELGSGFALAMKDLEIRGAGNILGPQQSGYIEEVGFDLYARLLEEAVAEIKGETIERLPDTKLDIDIEFMIPDRYVPIRQQKVEIYQKIAGARKLDEIERIRENVEDRFGRMPDIVSNLFDAAAVRLSAAVNQAEKVSMRGTRAEIAFEPTKEFTRKEVEAWRRATEAPLEFAFGEKPIITIDLGQINAKERLQFLRAVLNRV